MAVKGGELYFSHDCPMAGGLANQPISADQFRLHVNPTDQNQGGTVLEFIAAFRHDHPTAEDEGVYSEPITAEDLPTTSRMTQIIGEAAEGDEARLKIHRIGESLCQAISVCKGPQKQPDETVICPAYNKQALMRAILEVTE